MTTAMHPAKLERILNANDIIEMQDIVRKVPVAPHHPLRDEVARLTRKEKGEVPDFIKNMSGAPGLATQNLVLGAGARAVLRPILRVARTSGAVAIPVPSHHELQRGSRGDAGDDYPAARGYHSRVIRMRRLSAARRRRI